MSWLLHVANALYLVSYAVKDILWLRLVTCVANVSLLLMFSSLARPPAAPIAWQSLFLVINVARLVQLVHERRPVRLGADARRLARVLRDLRPRELLRLLAVGEVVDHAAGATVIRRGEPLAHLAIVLDGTARVEVAGAAVAELGHGAFIGELCYLCGRPPGADVVAASPLRTARWPVPALRAHLAANPSTHAAIQLVLGTDLATKLRGKT